MLPLYDVVFRDHLRIRRTEIERPRHKAKKNVGRPPRNNVDYGESLQRNVDIVIRSFEELVGTQPPEFNPALIFKIRVDTGAISDDDWRRSNLTILSEEPDGAIVLFSSDQLAEFRNRVGLYSNPIAEGKNNPRYAWIASLTEEMELWGRENRIGRKLRNIEINPDAEYYLDVELWVFGSEEQNRQRIEVLEQFIINNGGRVTDRYPGENLFLARVSVRGAVLNQMLEIGDIREIDLPPAPAMEMPEYYNSQIDDFDTPIKVPRPRLSKRLCY